MLTGGRGDAERYPTDDVTLRWKEAMFHVKHKHSPSVRLTGGKRGSITEVKPGHGNPKSAMFHVKHRWPSARLTFLAERCLRSAPGTFHFS